MSVNDLPDALAASCARLSARVKELEAELLACRRFVPTATAETWREAYSQCSAALGRMIEVSQCRQNNAYDRKVLAEHIAALGRGYMALLPDVAARYGLTLAPQAEGREA